MISPTMELMPFVGIGIIAGLVLSWPLAWIWGKIKRIFRRPGSEW